VCLELKTLVFSFLIRFEFSGREVTVM